MTVSSSSEAPASPSAAAPPPDATADAATLRVFAVILCSECQYLEFPGCDVHGALYTQALADADGKLQAKCPSCTAATNNARPFRDGCRRCKAATAVAMWAVSLQEVQQALEAFPATTEEVAHSRQAAQGGQLPAQHASCGRMSAQRHAAANGAGATAQERAQVRGGEDSELSGGPETHGQAAVPTKEAGTHYTAKPFASGKELKDKMGDVVGD
ncbi:unnamed protein product [Phytophthora lilii]|uniref:Unnamed protein product n=1 Tax=Phytophthora lilii TaxID=2077276 RepID=A0A9W6TE77_9STRA|nr:unnamed protein product [Phytophthora lilii]